MVLCPQYVLKGHMFSLGMAEQAAQYLTDQEGFLQELSICMALYGIFHFSDRTSRCPAGPHTTTPQPNHDTKPIHLYHHILSFAHHTHTACSSTILNGSFRTTSSSHSTPAKVTDQTQRKAMHYIILIIIDIPASISHPRLHSISLMTIPTSPRAFFVAKVSTDQTTSVMHSNPSSSGDGMGQSLQCMQAELKRNHKTTTTKKKE